MSKDQRIRSEAPWRSASTNSDDLNSESKNFTVRLNDYEHNKLTNAAMDRKITRVEVIRDLIRRYL